MIAKAKRYKRHDKIISESKFRSSQWQKRFFNKLYHNKVED